MSPSAVLTPEAVVEIREAYAAGEASQYELAERYGVEQGTIGAIVLGRTWKRVGGPITRKGKPDPVLHAPGSVTARTRCGERYGVVAEQGQVITCRTCLRNLRRVDTAKSTHDEPRAGRQPPRSRPAKAARRTHSTREPQE